MHTPFSSSFLGSREEALVLRSAIPHVSTKPNSPCHSVRYTYTTQKHAPPNFTTTSMKPNTNTQQHNNVPVGGIQAPHIPASIGGGPCCRPPPPGTPVPTHALPPTTARHCAAQPGQTVLRWCLHSVPAHASSGPPSMVGPGPAAPRLHRHSRQRGRGRPYCRLASMPLRACLEGPVSDQMNDSGWAASTQHKVCRCVGIPHQLHGPKQRNKHQTITAKRERLGVCKNHSVTQTMAFATLASVTPPFAQTHRVTINPATMWCTSAL